MGAYRNGLVALAGIDPSPAPSPPASPPPSIPAMIPATIVFAQQSQTPSGPTLTQTMSTISMFLNIAMSLTSMYVLLLTIRERRAKA